MKFKSGTILFFSKKKKERKESISRVKGRICFNFILIYLGASVFPSSSPSLVIWWGWREVWELHLLH